jgi:hypothetical protein
MSAKELIEAASSWKHSIETSRVMTGSFELESIFHRQLDVCNHILATVRPDDDEPVTRESCLAMGARIHGHQKYAFHLLGGRTLVVDMTLPDETETEVYVENYDSSVTIKWSPTNHDLRRLLAALGE